jgi:hypothetical protein
LKNGKCLFRVEPVDEANPLGSGLGEFSVWGVQS